MFDALFSSDGLLILMVAGGLLLLVADLVTAPPTAAPLDERPQAGQGRATADRRAAA